MRWNGMFCGLGASLKNRRYGPVVEELAGSTASKVNEMLLNSATTVLGVLVINGREFAYFLIFPHVCRCNEKVLAVFYRQFWQCLKTGSERTRSLTVTTKERCALLPQNNAQTLYWEGKSDKGKGRSPGSNCCCIGGLIMFVVCSIRREHFHSNDLLA